MRSIEAIKAEIEAIKAEIRDFNPADHITVDDYDDFLDDCYGDVVIAGYTYSASVALKRVDPTAYDVGFNEYADSLDHDGFPAYTDLLEALGELEAELEELEG